MRTDKNPEPPQGSDDDIEQYIRLVTPVLTRIERLQNSQRLLATWHTEHHVTLTNPATGRSVEFYPPKGTIIRDKVRQTSIGLDAALKLLGLLYERR